MLIFNGDQKFESFYLKHFDNFEDLQNCTECFKNLAIYSQSIYYQSLQNDTGSFKRILTENDSWLDDNFWKNGGNNFTSSFKLGTLNSNELNFITSGSNRLTISSFGNIQISKSVNIDENLTISGSTTILSTLYDSLLEAGSTNQFLKSNNISGSQWTTIQMSHVSGLLNYTSSISSSFVDINNSINNLNQVSASFKTFTSSLNIWTGSFSSSVNTQFSNINTSLIGLNTFSSSINSLTSSYFIQGGNSFGTSALLGTNDNQPLNLETSGSIRINISTLGDVVVFKGFEVKQNLLVRGSTFLYSALYDSNISAGSSTQFLRSVSTNGTVWTDIQMSHVSGLLNYTSSISSSLNSLNSYTSSNNTVLNNFSVYTSSLNIATGSFFRQGGNSFGTSGSIGTNDNNSLVFKTNNINRMFVSSSGDVGIGTSSPLVKLHVAGVTVNSDVVIFTGANTSRGLKIGTGVVLNNDDLVKFDAQTISGEFSFLTNSSEKIRIKNNGNVLIGTTTDGGYKLDVDGTLRNTTSTYLATTSGNVGIGTTSPTKKLSVNGEGIFNDVITVSSSVANEGGQITLLRPSNGTKDWAIDNYQSNFRILNDTDGLVSLIAIPSGYIGIGVTPTERLQIDVPNVAGTKLLKYTTANGVNNYGSVSVESGELRYSSPFSIGIAPNNTISVFFKSDGKVGIGTTTPSTSAKLDITSTTSGVLFPRMTTSEKNAISASAGLVLYDTTLSKLQVYTTTWENLH